MTENPKLFYLSLVVTRCITMVPNDNFFVDRLHKKHIETMGGRGLICILSSITLSNWVELSLCHARKKSVFLVDQEFHSNPSFENRDL